MRLGPLQLVSALLLVSIPVPGSIRALAQSPPATGRAADAGGNAESGNFAGSGPIRKVGGDVSAPEVIHTVDAEFSDEARRKGAGGVVLVDFIVGARGWR